MISAHSRRSLRELTRRKARSILTISTIAVAIAGIWLFAIPGNVDASLDQRVETDGMHTARLAPTAADLTDEQLGALRTVTNVEALDTRTLGVSQIRVGERTEGVILVGVEDFDRQHVNIVSVEEGTFPSADGQLVTDYENARTGRYRGRVGDSVAVRSHTGAWVEFEVAGRGGTLRYSSEVGDDAPVLYMSNADVQEVMGYPAPNSIDVIATDPSPTAVATMVATLRSDLAAELPDLEYWDVLEVWKAGTWPGSEDFDNFLVVFYVIAGVALVSALVLIFTTMNSVVREQTREIGMMKAVGGTPRTIGLGFLRTAVLIGGLGTFVGIVIGIPLSNWVMTFMSAEFGGTTVGWRFSLLALVLSLVVGLGGTVLAAWPALHRAAGITVREAVEDHGVVASYGLRPLDRLATRMRFLPRRSQIGLRNATRRAGRTFATAVPIGLAVGTMLAFGAVLITVVDVDTKTSELEGGDIIVWNNGRRGLDERAGTLMAEVPEVESAHQMIYSSVELDGEKYVWGLPAVSTYDAELVDGRWYTEVEAASGDRVAVIGEALAALVEIDVGDVVTVETRRGPIDIEVIGIDAQLVNDGQGLFIPFLTVLDYEGWTSGNYWVRTIDPRPGTVDAAADGIHQVLQRNGYEIGSSLRYIDRAENRSENRLIVTVVMAMGLPVVAIGMIGLVSSMTSNVLDRTREIGILRSIGARRRDLRAMFRAEGATIALLGWLLGLPIGYGLGRFIMWVLENEFHAAFAFQFPLWPIVVSLLVTLAATLIVLRFPLRRALRMQPGAALRYE